MGNWLGGMKLDTLSSIGEEAVERFLLNSIYPEAYDAIESHKSNGAEIAILSSALSEICHPVASHLGIGNVICTEMESGNGLLTGSPSGSYCYGPEKRRRIEEFCNLNGFDRSTAWYYADSISDLPALETVGNPVCVNPERALRKIAREKNWQIKSWIINPGEK
jgi:HAD superfamily hydrolase (TIGR01490 family)